MKNMMTRYFTILFFFSIPNVTQSQKLISDSLILDLKYTAPNSQQLTVKIDTVFDLRNVDDPRLIIIDEIKHYGFVPVDYYIKSQKPLDEIIQKTFPFNSTIQNNSLSLGIKHFELSKRSQFFFFKKYNLKVLIEIYNQTNSDSLLPIGELIYNSGTTKFFTNAKLKKGYENVFGIWCLELTKNLRSVSQHLHNDQNPLPYNFRFSQPELPWMQLYTGAEIVLFQKGFLVDGYLTFVYPETKRLFNKSAWALRFRKDKKFDSIEFGLLNSSLNYRLNSKFLLRFKYDLFFGINRWKDMNVTKHKVYDALIGDLSFSQNFIFFPIHKRTFFVGLGAFENLYYIYSKNFHFLPGLIINAGLQL